MPQVTEDQAIEALSLIDVLENEDEKAAARKIALGYEAQQSRLGKPLFPEFHRAQAEDFSRMRRMFTEERHGFDDDQFAEFSQTLMDPEKKARFLNEQFLSRQFQRPTSEIRNLGTQYRDAYAKAAWGLPVATDAEFQRKISEDFGTEDAVADVANRASMQGLSSVASFSQIPEEVKNSDAFKRQEKRLTEVFEEQAAATAARLSPYRETVRQTVEDLQATMGVQAPGAEGEKAGFGDFANRLLEIPKEDRDFVISAIIANAGEGEGKNVGKKLAENFARGGADIGYALSNSNILYAGNRSRNELLSARRKLEQGLIPATTYGFGEMIADRIILDPTDAEGEQLQQVDPADEKSGIKEALALIDKEIEFHHLHKKLRTIAENDIDPAKGENIVTRGLYSAARSIPYTAVAMAPGGMFVNMAALNEESYYRLKEANPGMSDNEANAIASIGAPIQSLLETVSAKILTGRMPTLGRFLNKAVATKGAAATRFGVRAVESAALEMVQENLQDVTPFAVQGAVAALSDDIPEVQWNEIYGDFWNQQGELFFAVLPLALIGAGAGTVSDFKNGKALLSSPREITSIIGNEAKASEIADLAKDGNFEGAQSLLREELRNVGKDSAPIQETRLKAVEVIQKDSAEKRQAIEKGEAIGMIPVVSPLADGKWVVRFNDKTDRTFDNFTEANEARWKHSGNESMRYHEDIVETITHADRTQREGQGTRYIFGQGKERLLDRVNRGEVSRESALNRADTAADVDQQAEEKTDEEIKAGIGQEYEESYTAAQLKALSEDDRLAALTIIGENSTEFENGLYITTAKLHGGATWATVIEEKLEGDVSVMLKKGRRDWLQQSLRTFERQSGETIFRAGIKDDDITDGDLKEAYARAGLAYFIGTADEKDGFQRSAKFKKRYDGFVKAGLSGSMEGYARFFSAVAIRADSLQQMRKRGALDPELERELARSTGFGEQAQFEQSVEKEAAANLEELTGAGFVASEGNASDDAPFSVIANREASNFDEAREAAQEFVGKPLTNSFGIEAVVSNNSLKKMLSESAARKSASPKVHAMAVANVDEIYSLASRHEDQSDREGDVNIRAIHRFFSDVSIDGVDYTVKTTVKELSRPDQVNPLYTVEALETVSPSGKSVDSTVRRSDPTSTAQEGDIQESQNFGSESSFSVISNADSRIADSFSPFLRDPEQKRRILIEAQRRGVEQGRKFQEIIRFNRSNADIETERKTREGEIMGDKLDTLSPSEIGALEALGTLDDVGMRPILSDLLREKYYKTKSGKSVRYWRGSLMSKSAAEKAGIDTKGGEWDGIPEGLPPYVWGGSIKPDQAAAQFGYESTEDFWTALSSEVASYQNLKADTKAAMTRIRELEKEAKAESREWAAEQLKLRKTVGTDRATLIAAMRTLQAMVSALPSEIRGKIGGFVRLAQFKTPGAMVDFLEERIAKMNDVLDTHIKEESREAIEKIFGKARAKRESGKRDEGKLGAFGHEWFDYAEKVAALSPTEVDGEVSQIEGWLEQGELSDDNLRFVSEWVKEPITNEDVASDLLDERLNIASIIGGVLWGNVGTGAKDRRNLLSAEDMATAVDLANDLYTNNRFEWLKVLAERRERRAEIREAMIEALGGKSSDPERIKQAAKDHANLLRKLEGWFDSGFDFALAIEDLLGTSSAGKTIIRQLRKADNAEKDGIKKRRQEFDSILRNVFPGLGSVGRNSKLYDLATDRPVPNVEIKGTPAYMSETKAIHYTMLGTDPDSREWLDSHGYTEEVLKGLEDFLSPEAKRLRDWLAKQYDEQYDRINAVYRKLKGVNLPRVAFYAPRMVEHMLTVNEGDMSIPGAMEGGMSTGFLKRRTQTPRGEAKPVDALATYWQNAFMVEHYISHAEFAADLKSTLGHKDVRLSIETNRGKEKAGQISQWVRDIDAGGRKGLVLSKYISHVTQAVARTALGYKLGVLAKQMPAALGSAAHIGIGEYARAYSRVTRGKGAISLIDMYRSPVVQRRIDEYGPEMKTAFKAGAKPFEARLISTKGHLAAESFLDFGMGALGWTDAGFTTLSAAIAYDSHFNAAKKSGLDDVTSHQIAMEQTEDTVARTAQPDSVATRSAFEVGLGSLKVLFMFQGPSRQAFAMTYLALKQTLRGQEGGARKLARQVFIHHFVVGSMLQTIGNVMRTAFSDDEPEEIWEIEDYLKAWILGPLTGALWFGTAADAFASAIGGFERRFAPAVPTDAGGAVFAVKNVVQDVLSGEPPTRAEIERVITATGQALGGSTAALGVAVNLWKQISGLANNLTE